MINLFPDQADLVSNVSNSMKRGNKRVLMQSMTGSGKTIMAAWMIRESMQRNISSWFVAPRKELIRQTATTYNNFNIPHSYISAGLEYNVLADNFICSLQTLPRRLDKLAAPKIAVIDEVHYGGAQLDTLINWLTDAGSWIIGLTATPKKTNGDGFDRWFDDMCLGLTMEELIALGRLSSYELFAPSRPDLSDIKTMAGDYNKKQLNEYMHDHGEVLIGDAIRTYKEKAFGKLGITFCTSIEESKKTAQLYNDAGIPAQHIDGTMSDDIRKIVIGRFADRQYLQLCSVDLMTFGFDLAAQVGRDVVIETMTDLAPTKSESKQLQKWGRVLRKKHDPALIFDHAGNVYEHGMPDAEREWSLKGAEKKRRGSTERDIPIRVCTACAYSHKVLPSCPNCGHIYPVQSRVIKQVDGELELVKEIQAKKEKRMEVGMAKTIADLQAIARERGYKPHWVKVMAKKKGIKR